MKCYFRVADEWIKGYISSLHGNSEVHFTAEPHTSMKEFLIGHPETSFHSNYFCVSGYMPIEVGYQFISVDVSGGWVKPKK